ncbi:ABC transporter permease [Bacillus cereus]|uniref:FtsX-like permease family protein n=1 Tax=Bacillus cereus group TaxID=86661 RepID=UPI000BFC20F6|nr:ABC transporter permease [Bacillus thuringiensis]MDA2520207.1 ABC transporter permease [Bacillus cereus]PGP40925.1 ABC transporter permease [Bacillus thuringiensis]
MTFRQLAFNNVLRNKRIYLGHFFSSTFALMIFFTYGLLVFHPNLQGELTHASTIMNAFGKIGFQVSYYLIFVFSFLFIFYSVSAFLKNRKKEFGLLMLHGMSHQQLHRLIFFENMLIGIPSILAGIGLGMVFSKLFLLVSGSLLAIEHTLSFYFPLKSMGVTAIAFSVLFLLISLFTSKMVKMNELVELIKSEEKPKPEPKASVWISLLAMILIGAGYSVVHYCIVAVHYVSSLNQLFLLVGVGVLLIVCGTYFFFTQLCVYVIYTLKNRETTFFKRTNLLVISELAFRMKDNARTFFIVTIISAVSFTAIGVCTAIANPELAKNETPYAFTYQSDKGNTQEKSHIEEIKKQLEESGFSYELVVTKFKMAQNEVLINLSTYNEYAKKLGYEIEELTNENESIDILPKKNHTSAEHRKTFELKYDELEVPLSVQKTIYIPEFAKIYNPVIVSDAVYSKVLNVQQESVLRDYTIYGFIIKNWSETSEISSKLIKLIGTSQDDFYDFSSLYLKWLDLKQQNGLLSISSVLVGIVFFVFTLSFLYFRLFTDLERDQEQYQMLSKLGLSQKELKQIVTRQMMILFFLPIVVAMVHSSFAFLTLHQLGQTVSRELSVIQSSIVVLVSFIGMQIIYFLIIRNHYIKRICTKIYS